MKILGLIIGVLGGFLILFLYCACVVSSRCSRMEENYERKISKIN